MPPQRNRMNRLRANQARAARDAVYYGAVAAAYPARMVYDSYSAAGTPKGKPRDANLFARSAAMSTGNPIPGYKKAKMPKKKCVKSNAGLSKEVCSIKSKVDKLKLTADQSSGNLTYRLSRPSRLIAEESKQNLEFFTGTNIGLFQSVLAQLKFFDPNNPTVLLTATQASGTYQRNSLFKSITSKITCKNNYQSDCKIKVYLCKVKDDTDQSPLQAYVNGIAKSVYKPAPDLPLVTDTGSYPTDCNLVNDLYSLSVLHSSVLNPGQSVVCTHTVNNVEYDSSTAAVHALDYQREYKAFGFLVCISGGICHDTDDIGLIKAAVDIVNEDIYKVSYNAGSNITYVYNLTTWPDSLTSPKQSNCPQSDNQGYDV